MSKLQIAVVLSVLTTICGILAVSIAVAPSVLPGAAENKLLEPLFYATVPLFAAGVTSIFVMLGAKW